MESWDVAYRPTDYILMTIRITIQIQESVPDHDPDPVRTATSTHTQNRCPQCSLNEFSFGDDTDHRPDPGVRNLKHGFTGLSIMLTFGGVCAL